MATRTPSSEFRILSLSGGGFLGLYTAVVLADLEARVGEPLGRRFDLIAGTSVGGLLAMALAFEVPMARIVKLFVERGEEVFSLRSLPGSAVTRLIDLTRSVLGPKYSGDALRRELVGHFGKLTLGDALHAVVVPAVDVTRSVTKVFKTPHAQASLGDEASESVQSLFMEPVAPPRWWMQGAHRSRAGGPARICNAADAAWAGQPFGQGSKKPHSSLRTLARPPAWPAVRA